MLSLRCLESRYQLLITDEQLRFERPWAALLRWAPHWRGSAASGYSACRGLGFSSVAPQRCGSQRARGGSRLATCRAPCGRSRWRSSSSALAGPQSIHARDTAEVSGIEIILTLDMSGSMEAADIRPTRFKATKSVVRDFINRDPTTASARWCSDAMPTRCSRSRRTEKRLRTALRGLQLDQIDGRGTAIGNAVGVSLNRLKRSRAKSKVMILLTDGESNAGNVSPSQAADLASAMGVKIYPILMGCLGRAPVQQGTGLFGASDLRNGELPRQSRACSTRWPTNGRRVLPGERP